MHFVFDQMSFLSICYEVRRLLDTPAARMLSNEGGSQDDTEQFGQGGAFNSAFAYQSSNHELENIRAGQVAEEVNQRKRADSGAPLYETYIDQVEKVCLTKLTLRIEHRMMSS
jgi:hypothetical protein